MRKPPRARWLLGAILTLGTWIICGCSELYRAYPTRKPYIIGMILVDATPLNVRVLKEGIEAAACPNLEGVGGNYNSAVAAAIETVPGANVLLNARFSYQIDLDRACVKVAGDAGVVP